MERRRFSSLKHCFLVILGTHFFCTVLCDKISLGSLNTWNFNGLKADDVTLLNPKQMKISDLFFTPEGPAVWFIVGKGSDYTEEWTELEGIIIPDEQGSCDRLKGYDSDDILLTLPGDMEFTDYDFLSVFCIRFNHNFGYVTIPRNELKANKNFTSQRMPDADDESSLPRYCPQDVEDRTPA